MRIEPRLRHYYILREIRIYRNLALRRELEDRFDYLYKLYALIDASVCDGQAKIRHYYRDLAYDSIFEGKITTWK